MHYSNEQLFSELWALRLFWIDQQNNSFCWILHKLLNIAGSAPVNIQTVSRQAILSRVNVDIIRKVEFFPFIFSMIYLIQNPYVTILEFTNAHQNIRDPWPIPITPKTSTPYRIIHRQCMKNRQATQEPNTSITFQII